jgi:hypothetical protein
MGLTAEKLTAILQQGDEQACLAFFSGATEAQRQTVAELAGRWFKEQCAQMFIETGPGRFSRNPLLTSAAVAVLATGSFSQLKKLGWRAIPEEGLAYQILADRCPSWLDDWARLVLEAQPRFWPTVRRLVREGLCARPETDNYWLGMLDTHSNALGHSKSVRKGLLADPGLLDEVWRLFEIEGSGEFSLAARDNCSQPDGRWETALVQLAAEGKLSRARLLDASLDALARDFAQFRAGWFSRFHEALQPTLAERAERAERYLHLLASKIPPTVSFALNALTLLDKASKLAPATVVAHIGPALFARQKGTVQKALKLLDRAAQTEPAVSAQIAQRAAEAIRHESAEVQGAVLDLVQKHGVPTDGALVELLRPQAGALAASQRPRLLAWLGSPGEEPARANGKGPEAPAKELLVRARKIPPEVARLAGVDQAVAALKAGGCHVPALEFTSSEIPHLQSDHVMQPIQDLDELIDRFAAVLEDPGSPDQIEAVLDGVSRLCGQRPEDFGRRTGPLAKRARALLKRCWGGAFIGSGPLPDLCGLALAWITGQIPQSPADQAVHEKTRTVLHFLSQRVRDIAERAGRGEARLLLAAPTHQGGWIDPLVLVDRIRSLPDPAARPDRLDEIQALLRLAPDNRPAALRKAGKLPGEFGDALRYALGGKGGAVGPTAALWVAAARARRPLADDPDVEARHPSLGPDAGTAARLSLQTKVYQQRNYFHLDQQHPVPARVPLELPTVLLHVGARVKGWTCPAEHWDAAAVRWAGTVWPLSREAWIAAGTFLVGQNLDWWEAEWGNRAYLEPLLDPDVPLQPMTLLLLVLGLAAKEPGESGLATDALIAAIDDGRLDGCKLGAGMASLLACGLIKLGRWAKTLAEAARISVLHAEVVALAVERLLQGITGQAPKDLQALLELLKELLMAGGKSVSSETRDTLSRLPGTGKTGKLAREILALAEKADSAHNQGAAVRALAKRLERAERWSRGPS